jgi:hypothetical protein
MAARHERLVEPAHHLAGGLWTLARFLLEAPSDEVHERDGRVGAHGRQQRRRLGHLCGEQRGRRAAGERRRASKQLVRHDAERVDVGAMVGARVRGGLLRRHVERSA